jgi:hypothetical protein
VSALDNDRYDLLIGREKRLRRAYQEKANAQQRQLGWVHDATRGKQDHPQLTVAQYDAEVSDGLRLANAEMQIALREWLEVRDELVELGAPE